jgi:hypothetical protein
VLVNAFLIAPFAIKNAFTSTDAVVADKFVCESKKRINVHPGEWSKIGRVLEDTARKWIFFRLQSRWVRGKFVTVQQ